MPRRTAIGRLAIVLGAVIVVAAIGVLFFTNQANPGVPVTTFTVSTQSEGQSTASGSVTASASSEACYEGVLPTNSSASGAQPTYSRTAFNVTQEFNSWGWTSLSTFKVGSYTFATTNPATTPGVTQLEPQLFFKVTNSQGQAQTTSVTNLGGWNGQVWPPDMSLEQTLFGGNVTIQWLFLCDSPSVLLEVTTQ
jgi:hypothetical protein